MGLISMLMPRFASKSVRWLAVAISAGIFVAAILTQINGTESWYKYGYAVISTDSFGIFFFILISFFGLISMVYAVGYFERVTYISEPFFFGNMLFAIGTALGVVLTGNLIIMTLFWGMFSFPLILIMGKGQNLSAIKKTLILVIGVAAFYYAQKSFDIFGTAVPVGSTPAWVALVAFIIAALSKAGAIPFHAEVPETAEHIPPPAAAMLPAAFDKFLGVYLLIRIFNSLFVVPRSVQIALIIIGGATIIIASFSVAHKNFRRVLGFHAISQTGYIVIGIATANPVGMAGALFGMMNSAIYKGCLFFVAGAAEKKSGETDIDKMGGLASHLPIAFGAALVAGLSVVGVPPLNGFASKWLIFNGIIQGAQQLGPVWIFALVATLFGSVLTLANFSKVMHSVFLGRERDYDEGRNPNIWMNIPTIALAALCIIFGVGAFELALTRFILPAAGIPSETITPLFNVWVIIPATIFILIILAIGAMILWTGKVEQAREDYPAVGGEAGERAAQFNFSGLDFFVDIGKFPVIIGIRTLSAVKADLFEVLASVARGTAWAAGKLHGDSAVGYLTWIIAALAGLLWFLMHSYKTLSSF